MLILVLLGIYLCSSYWYRPMYFYRPFHRFGYRPMFRRPMDGFGHMGRGPRGFGHGGMPGGRPPHMGHR